MYSIVIQFRTHDESLMDNLREASANGEGFTIRSAGRQDFIEEPLVLTGEIHPEGAIESPALGDWYK